jgi:hypothetical protein
MFMEEQKYNFQSKLPNKKCQEIAVCNMKTKNKNKKNKN